MTAHNIFETISSQYFQLTNSEKKVADYVLRHRDRCPVHVHLRAGGGVHRG